MEVTNTHVLGKLPGNGPTMSFMLSGKKNRRMAFAAGGAGLALAFPFDFAFAFGTT